MTKPNVFLSRPILPAAMEQLSAVAELETWLKETPPPRELWIEKIKSADALVTMLVDRIDREVVESAGTKLKVIAQMAVGFDNIDIKAASSRKIAVGNTPSVLTETTADFTWALLMAAARRVVEAHNEVQEGIWKPWEPFVMCGQDIYGATIGIIGMGRIGQAVARRAAGFHMHILYTDLQPNAELDKELGTTFTSLEDLLSRSDFITLHTYLSPQTRHMLSKAQFEQMKPGAIVINTSRGQVIDQEALIWALETHTIAGAALDVTDPEPVQPNSPLLKMKNVVITPHIASASTQTRSRMSLMVAENVIAALQDKEIPYCVNPEIYRK
jgi:glyoxylate reductase